MLYFFFSIVEVLAHEGRHVRGHGALRSLIYRPLANLQSRRVEQRALLQCARTQYLPAAGHEQRRGHAWVEEYYRGEKVDAEDGCNLMHVVGAALCVLLHRCEAGEAAAAATAAAADAA